MTGVELNESDEEVLKKRGLWDQVTGGQSQMIDMWVV